MIDTTQRTWGLPAGQELNRSIAELVGWRIEPWENSPDQANIYRPDGQMAYCGWLDVALTHIPSFSTDLDAAILLPIRDDAEWNIKIRATGLHVATLGSFGTPWTVWYGETPALAVCRAWLAWKENN